MGAPKTGNVRNVVLVGQGGVGKTSLAEAMLHLSGKTARLGGHDGTKPTLDYDPEEVKRAFSISTTIAPIDWKGARINVLDAPVLPRFYRRRLCRDERLRDGSVCGRRRGRPAAYDG